MTSQREPTPEAGTRVIFGLRPVEELCRARPKDVQVVYLAEGRKGDDVQRVIAVARDRGIAVERRPRALVADLSGGKSVHQGIVAITGAYGYAAEADIQAEAKTRGEAPLVLILDGITDPQNLGALVRSAEVLGAHGVIVAEKESAPVGGGAVKASAGATERMKIARVPNLLRCIDRLRDAGVRVWGTTVTKDSRLVSEERLDGPTALIIGAEGRGLREAVARRCTGLVSVPMMGGVASLNASAAGAIVLYEALRQRRSSGSKDAALDASG